MLKKWLGQYRTRPERERPVHQERSAFFKERNRLFQLEEKRALDKALPWDVHVAVLLERLPVLVPELEEWEKDMLELQLTEAWEGGRTYPDELGIMDSKFEPPAFDGLFEESPVPLLGRESEADISGDRSTFNSHEVLFLLLLLL
ncbi:unnamed protein product [Chrysoparadoxa australica]